MSQQITEAFVVEFGANVHMLAQQKGSKLRPYVRQESINGKSKSFDRIGAVEDEIKSGRHDDTPQMDTPHSRRWCFLTAYRWADLIDDEDKVQMLNDPTSEYVLAAAWAHGHRMDTKILEAADADITTGEEADGSASLPTTQRYAANDGTNLSNLNVRTLIAIKSKFGVNDIDEDLPLHIACNQRQIDALLEDDQVTSADYANVKALVKGDVDSFMGFQFHRTNRVGLQVAALSGSATTGVVGSGTTLVGTRKVVAWAQPALILGIGMDVKSRISERADKNYSKQAYSSMMIGATRMEEEMVVIAHCSE